MLLLLSVLTAICGCFRCLQRHSRPPINSEPLHLLESGCFTLDVNHAGLIFQSGTDPGPPVIALLLSINMVLALLNPTYPAALDLCSRVPAHADLWHMLALLLIDETLVPFFERLMSHGFEILESGLHYRRWFEGLIRCELSVLPSPYPRSRMLFSSK